MDADASIDHGVGLLFLLREQVGARVVLTAVPGIDVEQAGQSRAADRWCPRQ